MKTVRMQIWRIAGVTAMICACTQVASQNAPDFSRLSDGVRVIQTREPNGGPLAIAAFVRQPSAQSASGEAIREEVNSALFFGSTHLSYDAALEAAGKVGGLQTIQSPDWVCIYCITSQSNYRDAIYLICESIKNADFNPDALEKARTQLIRSREARTADPFLSAYDSVTGAITGRFSPDSVQLRHVTQQQAAEYHRKVFLPSNTVFCVCGASDQTGVRKCLDNNLFDYEPPVGAKITVGVNPHGSVSSEPKMLTLTAPPATGAVSYAVVSVQTPPISDPDYPAFVVLTTVFGGGHASRMFQKIREKAGIGYEVGASCQMDQQDPMVAYVEWRSAASPTHSQVLAQIHAAIDSLSDPKFEVTEAELARAKAFARSQFQIRHERLFDRMFLPGMFEAIGVGYAFDTALPARILAVTQSDLKRVAANFLGVRCSLSVISGAVP